jgi:hypothetical protein
MRFPRNSIANCLPRLGFAALLLLAPCARPQSAAPNPSPSHPLSGTESIGKLYRVSNLGGDPKQYRTPRQYRTFVIVSRQALIDSRFSTVICAPVFTSGEGRSTVPCLVLLNADR